MKTLKTVKLKPQKSRTIIEATDVFPAYIDSDFKNWGLERQASPVTIEQDFDVKELTEDMTFAQMFNTKTDVMTQEQIVAFCEQYPNELHPDGYATFFLIKDNGNYYVVNADYLPERREVRVCRLGNVSVWHASDRYRLVVPHGTSTLSNDPISLSPSVSLNSFEKADNLAMDFCEKWCDGKARAVKELRDKILETYEK